VAARADTATADTATAETVRAALVATVTAAMTVRRPRRLVWPVSWAGWKGFRMSRNAPPGGRAGPPFTRIAGFYSMVCRAERKAAASIPVALCGKVVKLCEL
jgi:hypothetical protein